jgi:uncharacterized membrane protein
MHSSMKSIELKMQLCTKNNSMYVSMKVSFMVIKVIWFNNKKIIFDKNNKIFKEFDIC